MSEIERIEKLRQRESKRVRQKDTQRVRENYDLLIHL